MFTDDETINIILQNIYCWHLGIVVFCQWQYLQVFKYHDKNFFLVVFVLH